MYTHSCYTYIYIYLSLSLAYFFEDEAGGNTILSPVVGIRNVCNNLGTH